MARWLWMTGGLVIWFIQFCGLYALTSLADVVATADDLFWRWVGGGFSLICLIGCAALLVDALRRRRVSPAVPTDIAALCAGAGCIAVVWQALPLLLGA